MIYVLIVISLLFVAIGFILSEKNARYLLSGYNLMSEKDRQKFDIAAYVPYFRNFHVGLGVSIFVIGLPLTYGVSELAGMLFLVAYPILAYVYFLLASTKFSNGLSTTPNKVGAAVLVVVMLFVVALMVQSFSNL
jgi:hypothetical protein